MAGTTLRRGVIGLLALAALSSWAGEAPEYRVKAELLERFTRYVEWPADTRSPFRICLFGGSPLGESLEELAAARKIKNREAEIRTISRIPEADSCHVLFIPSSGGDSLERILLRTAGKPVLTVGDAAGFAERGVIINFYVEQQHVQFEINESMAKKSGLEVSSRLLKLARVLKTEEHR